MSCCLEESIWSSVIWFCLWLIRRVCCLLGDWNASQGCQEVRGMELHGDNIGPALPACTGLSIGKGSVWLTISRIERYWRKGYFYLFHIYPSRSQTLQALTSYRDIDVWSGGADRSSFLSVSCQLVAALLTSAMESLLEGKDSTMGSKKTTTSSAGNFCKEIVSLFIEPAMAMLSQPMNSLLRHQAMFILLPPILKAIRSNMTSNSSEELETAEARWE